MLSAYWLRCEIRSKTSTTCQGLRGTPFLVVPDLLAACLHVSCWWFLWKATGGPLCRELDWWYVPLLLVQLEPQLDLLLHGVKHDIHHPNSDILEQRYTENLLVMVNNLSWRISW